ncbi:MAG: right-handed parallel beta-helix repeat-containing protein [Actinomycetota bacterium]|nr:right-handed parallel beta-helix repeat-containing protein [Actinomycetota bacterium]
MKLRVVITILALSCAAALAPASAAPRQRVHARTSPFSGQALLLQRAVANAVPSLQAAPVATGASKGARLCVGSASGCYSTIQAALDASHDGDTIALGRGTFAGGATVTTSVRIVGSGAGATVIKGGGPVLTIGRIGAASEPTVSLDGVTITGGSTSSSPESGAFVGVENVIALGGGIEVPPGAQFAPGASVTISNSVISGNRVAPKATFAPPPDQADGWPACPAGPCPFAQAGGGGIDTWGDLTLSNTRVTDNQLGGPASDADGGGIYAHGNNLSLTNVVVSGNRASASAPHSRFAEGGGIFADSGTALVIKNSAITSNTVALSSSLPYFLADGETIDMNANSGGVHVGDGASVAIDNTRIDGNSISLDDLNGEPAGFDAGMCICGGSSLVLRNSSVSGNQLAATVESTEDVGPSGSALEFDGDATIDNSRVTGNRVTVTSPSGVAGAIGAISAFSQDQPALISNSVISGNSMSASSPAGSATVIGGGLTNNGLLELRNDQIRGNTGVATGPAGFAQGGGIWNDVLFHDPPVVLALHNTVVAENVLKASAGLSREGGGIFTGFAVVLDHSLVAHNDPDQCFGC